MARRIQSPGVQITEFDLSERPPLAAGTSIFVTGFADQGPTDEVITLNTLSDFQNIYGLPTNAAERYFYHTVKGAINSNATILTNRIPYGSGSGTGFGSYYTALVYPAKFYNLGSANTPQVTTLTINAATSAAFAIQGSNGEVYAITYRGQNSTAVDALTAYVNSLPNGVVATVTGTANSTTSYAAAIASYFEGIDPDIFSIELDGSTLTFTNSAASTVAFAPSGISGKTTTQVTTVGIAGTSGITTNLNGVSGVYFLGAPKQFSLTQAQYQSIVDGTGFTWGVNASATADITGVSDFGGAGVIVLNKRQTAIDQAFQGYYLGLVDNVDADNQGSNFNKINAIKTVTQIATGGYTGFINVPATTLAFNLTSSSTSTSQSIAREMETGSNGYVIGNNNEFDDVLNLGVFKLTNSVFQDDPNKLVYSLQELYTGSVTNQYRQFAAPTGGEPVSYSLQTIVGNRSVNTSILINPYINNVALDSLGKGSSFDTNSQYKTLKKVRLINSNLITNIVTLSSEIGFTESGVITDWYTPLTTLSGDIGLTDSLFPLGTYNPIGNNNQKVIGNLPSKVQKSLDKIRDPELFDVDVIVEGGLGTIHTFTNIAQADSYDDTANNANFTTALNALQSGIQTSSDIISDYKAIQDEFLTLAQPEKDGGRGDTFYVADPIRQFFVTGANSKVIDTVGKTYTNIYYSLRNLFSLYDTSFMGTYANWLAVTDEVTGLKTWVPSSGFAAAIYATTDAGKGPWEAPAGFNRGVVRGAIDVGWSPNQRQRDDLYKLGINPIASFPGQGIVIYGQKTLQNKPSAFDRINVRRSFLFMEKSVKNIMKFFVFEPNTKFTRDRVLATLNPFFIDIQSNDGLYDFLVVCDERNNSDTTIEDNTLVVDIYLKPTRTAEFILVNFYATRQSASFEELVARG